MRVVGIEISLHVLADGGNLGLFWLGGLCGCGGKGRIMGGGGDFFGRVGPRSKLGRSRELRCFGGGPCFSPRLCPPFFLCGCCGAPPYPSTFRGGPPAAHP